MTSPLFIDTYPGDRRVDWNAFIAAGAPWHGAIFKLTQGTRFEYASWCAAQRAAFILSPRYGVDLFDGFYHYLDLSVSGVEQADYFWQHVVVAGGEKIGTMWAMVDFERGGQRVIPPAARCREIVHDFAARYQQLSGRLPTLYGGELLRALGLDRMGCARSAVALYNAELHGANESTEHFLARTGTDLEHLLGWQYCGAISADKAESYLAGHPSKVPGAGGALDIYALTLPGGIEAMRAGLWAERPAP